MSDQAGYGFKVVIIGDGAVGKTSLIKKYTQGSFQKEYIATLGTSGTLPAKIHFKHYVKDFIQVVVVP